MQELKEQLVLLSPSSHPSSLVSMVSENETGVNHLGHNYNDQIISLKKQTLSFPCMIDGKSVKSPDFHNFLQYLDYMKKYKVTVTKRTLASLISTNADVTGRFLVLFKAKIKTVMRNFLKSNRTAAWDAPVPDELVPQVHNSIQTYFTLVSRELKEPLLAPCTSSATIIACSDSSELLGCFSISIIFEHVVQGVRTAQASHLSLQSYTAGLDIICIVTLEFIAFLKMLVELKIYLEELDHLGLNVPHERILCLSDSSILIRLLRTKLSLLQKKASHQVSKALLLLHDLGLDPHRSLAFANQSEISSWYPDILSRPHLSETSEQVLEKQQLLLDTTWLTEQPYPCFRGVEFNLKSLSYATTSELELLQQQVRASEWLQFEQLQLQELTTAAPTSPSPISPQPLGSLNCSAACSASPLQQDLHEGAVDLPWDNEEEETQEEDVFLPSEEKLPLQVTPPKEASPNPWKEQMDLLIERKFYLGLTKKGVLGILACVLRFLRLCQAGAKLPEQREERQKARQLRRREHLFLNSNPRPTCPSNPPLRDTHSLFCQAVDLTKSLLGIFDHRLTPSFAGLKFLFGGFKFSFQTFHENSTLL